MNSLYDMVDQTISVTLLHPLGSGAAGIVYHGIAAMNTRDFGVQTFPVAAKVAGNETQCSALHQEHRVYQHLAAHHVSGIPVALGLFESDAGTVLLLTLEGADMDGNTSLSPKIQ